MNIIDSFHIKKNNRNLNPSSYSLKLFKIRKFSNLNNNLNKQFYKNPFSNNNNDYNNILPQIKKSTISNINKNRKYFSKKSFNTIEHNQKNSDLFNNNNLSNSSIFQINNNIITIKKSALFNKNIRPLFNFKNIQNLPIEKSSSDSNLNIHNIKNNVIRDKKENIKRANSLVKNEIPKEFVKTVNIYFKNNFHNKEITDENKNKKEGEEDVEEVVLDPPKTKSMFMTGMNFLMPSNYKNKNLNKKNEINLENNKDKNINYNCLSFKELLKHIEENKKKIIDNQNDIEKMLMTAKDTHIEIWKCNHHKK